MTNDEYEAGLAAAEQRHTRRSKMVRFNALVAGAALVLGVFASEAARAEAGFGSTGGDRTWLWIVAATLVLYLTIEHRTASIQLANERADLRLLRQAQQHHEEIMGMRSGSAGPSA